MFKFKALRNETNLYPEIEERIYAKIPEAFC